MYSYYETFLYRNGSSTQRSIQINTFRIDVYDNLTEFRIEKLLLKFGRQATVNKARTKVYVRNKVREIRLHWSRRNYQTSSFNYGFINNFALGIHIEESNGKYERIHGNSHSGQG